MTEQQGELGLAAPGLAVGDLTAEEGLAGQARRLETTASLRRDHPVR